jgi:hypothetical protein
VSDEISAFEKPENLRSISPDDMFHLKTLSWDGLMGHRTITKARDSIGSGMAAERWGATYFRNGAAPSVVIEHPGRLTEQATINIARSWERKYSGIERSHLPAVLQEGMKVNPFSNNAADAQLLEMLNFKLRDVANWFGVPAHKLGDVASRSYASIEQENQDYLQSCLERWLVTWEEECWHKLLSEDEKAAESHEIAFLRRDLIRGDSTARGTYYHNGMQDGWLCPDDVRELEDLEPIPNGLGRTFLRPLNMQEATPPATTPTDRAEAERLKFLRDSWLKFQADGTVSDVQANLTDLKAMAKAVGLPVNGEYTDPYLPVVAAAGPLVSGDVIKDPEQDIVGGAVVPGSGGATTGHAPEPSESLDPEPNPQDQPSSKEMPA